MSHNYAEWIGRQQVREDLLSHQLVAGFRALLDVSEQDLPLGLHWLMGVDRVPQSALGQDGHPKKGDFLPPVSLTRRMWAAGDVKFLGDAVPGADVIRKSTIGDVQSKTGRSGELVFVRVDHEYRCNDQPWIVEQHHIVYREASSGPYKPAAFDPVDTSLWPVKATLVTDEVQLFRYSALTFNGHRIHYDQRYVTEVEGYPGLIVHGPLMATWLMNFAANTLVKNLRSFTFRVAAPVFSGDTITLLGRLEKPGMELAIVNSDGKLVLTATAE